MLLTVASRLLTLILLAVGADLVGLEFEEALDGCLVLRRPLGRGIRRSSGHDGTLLRMQQWQLERLAREVL